MAFKIKTNPLHQQVYLRKVKASGHETRMILYIENTAVLSRQKCNGGRGFSVTPLLPLTMCLSVGSWHVFGE